MSSPFRASGSVRRGLMVVAGTITGLVLVLSYRTPFNSQPTAAGVVQNPSSNSQTQKGSSGGGGSNGGSAQSATPANQTVSGSVVQTMYGPVQVQVTASGGSISDVQAVSLPNGDPHSSGISQYAAPLLRQQALQAQSAHIDGVAGASYTSQGYAQSLQSALNQLGL